MRVLITGATGYIGSFVSQGLLSSGTSLLSLTRRNHQLIQSGQNFRELQIADGIKPKTWEALKSFSPEMIIHIAALSSPSQCELDNQLAWATNVAFGERIVDLAHELKAYLCIFSSDLVFDGCKPPPPTGFTEEDQPDPRSVYAHTKHVFEGLVLERLPNSALVLRSSLVYGPNWGPLKSSLNWMYERFLHGDSVSLYSDEWRTPLYIGDMVKVIKQISVRRPIGILHSSGSLRLSRLEFGKLYCKCFDLPERLIISKRRCEGGDVPARPEDVSLCNRKICSELQTTFLSPLEGFKNFKEMALTGSL